MDIVVFLLTFVLLVVLGLVSLASGASPAPLGPVQAPLKPVNDALKPVAGILGIIAVIWGVWGVITFVVSLPAFSYAAWPMILSLFTHLTLIVVGTLAGYVGVAAYFGAPASGAGKFIDWIKNTFSSIEAIVGIVALVVAIGNLIQIAVSRGAYFP